jgi:hypothetical protein
METQRKNKDQKPHEVDSSEKGETFDEARYYEGDQFELGGVKYGDEDEKNPGQASENTPKPQDRGGPEGPFYNNF